jgi:hypothetical protein
MSLKLTTAALLALAVSSAPAFACSMTQGSQAINPPNLTDNDPAWAVFFPDTTFTIGGGNATVTSPSNEWAAVIYGGKFVNTGDICVSAVINNDPNGGAGIVFGDTNAGTYMFEIWANGEADVSEFTSQGWLNPVASVASSLVKTGANASNELRITWNASSASAYINGQLFKTFPVSAFQGSKIGLEVQSGGGASPTSVQFSNFSVTAASQ